MGMLWAFLDRKEPLNPLLGRYIRIYLYTDIYMYVRMYSVSLLLHVELMCAIVLLQLHKYSVEYAPHTKMYHCKLHTIIHMHMYKCDCICICTM